MSETKVVNLRLEKCDVKITRTPKHEIPDPPKFGCFGNPFFVEKYGRDKCIELFKEYFDDRIERDAAFRAAVLMLRGKKLGCFCKQPDKEVGCHGDIYKAWLDNPENQ